MPDSYPPPSAERAALARSALGAAVALIALALMPATAPASHNSNFLSAPAQFPAQAINAPGTPLPAFFENSPLVINHENLTDNWVNPGEPDQCSAGGETTNYGSTVYYEFHPHRNGRIRIIVQSQTPGFRPVVAWIPFTLGTGNWNGPLCNGSQPPINQATLPAGGYINVAAGAHYKIQVGGDNVPNVPTGSGGVPLKGNFRLYFVHDPNTDGDSLFDSADDCDGEHGGPFGIQGCPDSDRDRIRDRDDACDSEDARRGRDRNDNGCPDRERLNPRVVLDPASFCPRGVCVGIKVEVLVVSGVPRGSRVDVSCTRRACRRTSKVKRSKPIRLLRGKRLRAGVKVTVRVTKAGAVGRYFSYSIKKNNLRKTGEKRPLCLTSRKARPKRCTERQLIR